MNETRTRLDLIDPALKEAGWGVTDRSYIRVEVVITLGCLQAAGKRAKQNISNYMCLPMKPKCAPLPNSNNLCSTKPSPAN